MKDSNNFKVKRDKKELKLLIGKYLNNEASLYEMSRLDAWLEEDPEVTGWLSEMIEDSDPTVTPEAAIRLNSIFENRQHIAMPVANAEAEPVSNSGKRLKRALWGLAAAVAAIAVGGFALHLSNVQYPEPAPLIVSTSDGERSHVQLPDGSQISLNHNSRISYVFDKRHNSRRLQLDGEAYFEVNSDPEHPFLVNCNGLSIECKGTSFNVKGYADEQEVTAVLADGVITANADVQTITMKPGTKVSYDKSTRSLQSAMVEVSDYTCWTSGETRYNDDRLEDILHSVSRHFGVEINIVTPSLRDVRLSGSIAEKSLTETLAIIASASGATYFTESDSTICFYREAQQ